MTPDSTLSPGLLKKVVYAASCSSSFRQAADDLHMLAEVKVSAARVRRAAEQVGRERVAESRAKTAAYGCLSLPTQRENPGPTSPDVACVQADGGRIQIRPRDAEASDQDSWWRETKVGCLLSMTSETSEEDPAPVIPETFVDPARMAKISREIKGFSGESAGDSQPPQAEQKPREAPRVASQTVIATRENVASFGNQLAAAAHALGFATAGRKAFVADGSEANWGLWRRHFSHYTPILDWVHAVCYVYAAAMAGIEAREGWKTYGQWAQWLWSGQIAPLLVAIETRLASLGPPHDDEAESCPRRIVATTLGYLQNQRSRMKYPEYRRRGLPITSSHVESTIKRINRRMKGTEKFWDQGAEPLLHLVADHLGPPHNLETFWAARPQRLSPQRSYTSAA